ncbi:MAG: hypothetical protein DWH70_11750 [Planctomycetota bacterium]|nr:MAG: hypothetical protein DWH70_11750 [Planctomycetota bacterium]
MRQHRAKKSSAPNARKALLLASKRLCLPRQPQKTGSISHRRCRGRTGGESQAQKEKEEAKGFWLWVGH